MAKAGWGNNYSKISKLLDDLNGKEISVGIVDRKTHSSGPSIASIYFWNDQGTRKIPKRETLKPSIENMDFAPSVKVMMSAMVRGSYKARLEGIGKVMRDNVKKEIHAISSPPLSPATIKRRSGGGSNPLVDTKQLINSIDYKVE